MTVAELGADPEVDGHQEVNSEHRAHRRQENVCRKKEQVPLFLFESQEIC